MGFFKELFKGAFTGYVAGKVAADTIKKSQNTPPLPMAPVTEETKKVLSDAKDEIMKGNDVKAKMGLALFGGTSEIASIVDLGLALKKLDEKKKKDKEFWEDFYSKHPDELRFNKTYRRLKTERERLKSVLQSKL